MNIVIAQSGGPTAAINSSLLGVYRGALRSKDIDVVYGALNGIEGVIKNNLVVLNDHIRTYRDMELLRQTPSTILGSCRYKLKGMDDSLEEYEKIRKTLEDCGAGAFFYIGGNDSMDTVNKLSAYFEKAGSGIKVIGVPKTIDNDLCETDHTPGFGSAAKYVASTVREVIRDCTVYDVDSVTIIEIMGRDTGWLTASSCVLRAAGETAPHLIYLPESDFKVKNFLNDVRGVFKKSRTVIVAVSEGVEVDKEYAPEGRGEQVVDVFGHGYISGIGKSLENIVRKELGCKVRSIELNVLQRCSSHIASATDIAEAEQIGAAAVDAALAGKTGRVLVFKRVRNDPYSVVTEDVPAGMIANKVRYFPREWITPGGSNVTDDAVSYFLPLIQGERSVCFENGVPAHFTLRR